MPLTSELDGLKGLFERIEAVKDRDSRGLTELANTMDSLSRLLALTIVNASLPPDPAESYRAIGRFVEEEMPKYRSHWVHDFLTILETVAKIGNR